MIAYIWLSILVAIKLGETSVPSFDKFAKSGNFGNHCPHCPHLKRGTGYSYGPLWLIDSFFFWFNNDCIFSSNLWFALFVCLLACLPSIFALWCLKSCLVSGRRQGLLSTTVHTFVSANTNSSRIHRISPRGVFSYLLSRASVACVLVLCS